MGRGGLVGWGGVGLGSLGSSPARSKIAKLRHGFAQRGLIRGRGGRQKVCSLRLDVCFKWRVARLLCFSQDLEIKGQMVYCPESDTLLFVGSPYLDALEGLTGRGLFISDIPLHDATRDVILVGEQARAQVSQRRHLISAVGGNDAYLPYLDNEGIAACVRLFGPSFFREISAYFLFLFLFVMGSLAFNLLFFYMHRNLMS